MLVANRGRVDRDLRPRALMCGRVCSFEYYTSVWGFRKRFLAKTANVAAEAEGSQALTMAPLFDNDSVVSIRVVVHAVFRGRGQKAWLLGYG